jgi:glycosyltransferase involved in cell wall biosynthesis
MKISICIPTWEQYGNGLHYLKALLNSIKTQSFKNFNVIISDHSVDDGIKKLVESYNIFFDIVYIKNEYDRGNGPANTNIAIKNADGEIIKVMFQDDLFVDDNALQIIHNTFKETNCKWLVNGCNHTNDGITFNREMVPSWNDQILYGVNTISSPSVLSFINEEIVFFDENLTMLMDCEYYYQLYKKYGLPRVVSDILISNRMHQFQISSRYDKNINEEINYVKQKYNDNF